jgi:signal peptidase II
LIAFALIAGTIAVSDQILKRWIVANFDKVAPGRALDPPTPVVGDWLQIDFIHNNGGLFGLFQGSALLFAAITIGVVAILLALLLGGAIGNFIDRIRFGYVIDFVDIGIGGWRFYIFNIADSAVTVSILLMLLLWLIGPYLGVKVPLDGDDHGAGNDRTIDDAGSVKVQ